MPCILSRNRLEERQTHISAVLNSMNVKQLLLEAQGNPLTFAFFSCRAVGAKDQMFVDHAQLDTLANTTRL